MGDNIQTVSSDESDPVQSKASLKPSAGVEPEDRADDKTYGPLCELRFELEDCLCKLVASLVLMSWKGTVVQMDPSFLNLFSLVQGASNMLTVMTFSMIYPDSPAIFDPASTTLMFPLDTFGSKSVLNLLDEILCYLTELTAELGIMPSTFLSDVGSDGTEVDLSNQSGALHKPRRQLLDTLMSELTLDSVISAASGTRNESQTFQIPLLLVNSRTRKMLYDTLEAMHVANKTPTTFVDTFKQAFNHCFTQVNVIFNLIPRDSSSDAAILSHAQALQAAILYANSMSVSPIGLRPKIMLSFIESVFDPLLAIATAMNTLPLPFLAPTQLEENARDCPSRPHPIPLSILLDVLARRCASQIDFSTQNQSDSIHRISVQTMTPNVTQDEPLNFSEIQDARVALICKDAPWLGAKHDGYSPASFDNYKLRREPIAQLDLHRKRNSSFYAALQQSQYTFGLLETVLDKPISERYLLRRSLDGTKCISMQAVPYLLRECQSHVRNLWETNPDAYKQWSQRARHALEMTRQFISWESMEPDRTFSKVELDSQGVSCILFMISALTEALWNFLDGELQSAGVSDDLTVLGLPGDINASCHREMVENGWCPFATSQLHGYSTCALGFASTCEPFVRKGVGHRSHDQCTRDICVSNNIDPAVYTNLHVTEGCTCSFVVPPIERIKDALLRREIPIIRIHAVNTPDDADVKISCKTASSDTPYVAISHVWADGLGSTTERGLPMCQLRRLAEFAHSLVDGGFLWLDALCVPEEKELRKFAIGLMGQTYRQATKVFVIDSGIRSCPVNAPTEEKLLRVVTSGWMQRLWTLQEAVLASELIFQFADGLLTLGDLLRSGVDWTQPVAIQLCCAFGEVCMLMSTLSRPPSSLRLLGVVNALRGRSTSKLSDETLAISSLLGVDAYALANQDSLTERMKALLLQVKEIPSGLPFLVDGPRLTDRGFRWAPATFLRSGDASRIVGDGSALCTPNGLLARYYCFILRIPVALHKPYVILSKITLSGPDLVLYYADVNDPVEPASGVELCNAIILQTEPSFDNLAIAVSMEQDRIRSSDGVMRHRCAYIKALHLKHGILGVRSDIPLREPVDVEEGRFIDMCLI